MDLIPLGLQDIHGRLKLKVSETFSKALFDNQNITVVLKLACIYYLFLMFGNKHLIQNQK